MLGVRNNTVAIAVLCAALVGSGCALQASGGSGVAGVLERLKPLTENCDGQLNGYFGIDMSASARGDARLQEIRIAALKEAADQVAACGGTAKVVAFSASAPETLTLGEQDFPASFGTETARMIKADAIEGDLIGEVEDGLATAASELQPHGTDILAQLTLAKQYEEQSGEGDLFVLLETDGIATTKPVDMTAPQFDAKAARAAAETVSVPNLSGATVDIAGVGKSTGERQLSTEKATAIVEFFTQACERSGAECLVTNDYRAGG